MLPHLLGRMEQFASNSLILGFLLPVSLIIYKILYDSKRAEDEDTLSVTHYHQT